MAALLFDNVITLDSRGTTPEGLPCAFVTRMCEGRRTTYFLVQRSTSKGPRWFSCGPQQISTGETRFFPEKNGVRLTDSKLDRALVGAVEAS